MSSYANTMIDCLIEVDKPEDYTNKDVDENSDKCYNKAEVDIYKQVKETKRKINEERQVEYNVMLKKIRDRRIFVKRYCYKIRLTKR